MLATAQRTGLAIVTEVMALGDVPGRLRVCGRAADRRSHYTNYSRSRLLAIGKPALLKSI